MSPIVIQGSLTVIVGIALSIIAPLKMKTSYEK